MSDTEPKTARLPKEFELTTEQTDIIESLAKYQTQLGMSDGEFTHSFLLFTATKWNKIKNGKYFQEVAVSESIFIEMKQALDKIQRQNARASVRNKHAFHEFTNFKAVFNAIEECRDKTENRIIVYLAPTGGGKTALCRQIEAVGGCVTEARQNWLTSYYSALLDVSDSVGIFTGHGVSPRLLETKLIHRLCQNKRTLAIDEGEFFGKKVLNLWKLLDNKTPTVQVILAIPEAYRRWNTANSHEAKQLRRRTHAIITHEKISPTDAGVFLKPFNMNGSFEQAAVLASKAANQFGAYDFLTRLGHVLAKEKRVELDDVQAAIERVQVFMGIDPNALDSDVVEAKR